MSTLSLDPDEFRTLEALRQRLATLTANLRSLCDGVARSNPLPSPPSLQASARIAQQNLSSLQALLADRREELFARLAVHPSTNFPGREQEAVLQTILRKKLEPEVEGWVERCREVALRAGVMAEAAVGEGRGGRRKEGRVGGEEEEDGEDEDEDEEGYRPEDEDENGGNPLTDLWADVRDALLVRLRSFIEGESQDVYTAAERELGVEKIRTGLRRDLEEEMAEEEVDSEDDEEEEEGAGKAGGGAGGDDDDDVVMLGPGGGPVAGQVAKPVQQQQQQQQQGPRVEVEHVLWFGSRGDFAVPGNIETGATRKAKAGAGIGRRGPGR